ncbi:MAG: 50S ribosomal protein L15 [Candidatus Komeilibacteria bacterium]|nr:50S ribosomal protein L15 [Candidatus Komeilibacteria bacterium]
MKGLHLLKRARGSRIKKTRIGRGNGSGIGSYSGKGIKGQRARAGGRSGITARSMRQYLLRIPKVRGKGFKPQSSSYAIVTLGQLQTHFNDGEAVTLHHLRHKQLLSGMSEVKILSGGELSKKLEIQAHAFSASAKAQIEKAGGTATVIAASEKKKK